MLNLPKGETWQGLEAQPHVGSFKSRVESIGPEVGYRLRLALIGQLYPAIVLGRLLSLPASERSSSDGPPSETGSP